MVEMLPKWWPKPHTLAPVSWPLTQVWPYRQEFGLPVILSLLTDSISSSSSSSMVQLVHINKQLICHKVTCILTSVVCTVVLFCSQTLDTPYLLFCWILDIFLVTVFQRVNSLFESVTVQLSLIKFILLPGIQ